MAVLKREYEISVWHEKLNENGNKIEEKMAVIGAHDMTYLGRATNVKLITKLNGTHTLTFQMPDKWYDSQTGDFVQNEFKDIAVNENKIKLFYKDKWLEFFIKSCKLNKHYKSYMYDYSCSDAFIDELSRNGYGITFDTELYNNVEEIGIFSEEILEDSQWTYTPEHSWGDFTEYIEEKLFKVPVSQFSSIKAKKLTFIIDKESDAIINNTTKERRQLEIGDDLAREKGYFWDCYDGDRNVELKDMDIIPNDGYLYIPYSQLDFCYCTTSSEQPELTATEEPWVNGENHYYIAPTTIDPNVLIQFIAIPEGGEVKIDESGLILDKDYTYVMTVADWNSFVKDNNWYIFESDELINNKVRKYHTNEDNGTNRFYGNKAVLYDGYLDSINDIEVENGKKIVISNRTEINISEEIDQYVEVYNNKANEDEYNSMYSNNENWAGEKDNYRVCSKISTRQIIPQLARNYIQNGVNIQSTNGWEIMSVPQTAAASIKIEEYDNENQQGENQQEIQKDIKNTCLSFTPCNSIEHNYNYNTIINFGAIGQEKIIEKDKVYCLGAIFKDTEHPNNPITLDFKIGTGTALSEGNYSFDDENVETIELTSGHFNLIKFNHSIENPYLCIYSSKAYKLKSLWFFEAYTKGTDFFPIEKTAEKIYKGFYRYSGRDILLNENENMEFSEQEIRERVLFETDIFAGATYEQKKYFIQQLKVPKQNSDEYNTFDTFGATTYLSADKYKENSLPLNAAQYSEDDYKIVTNYIDLNKCKYYKGNTSGDQKYDCTYNGNNLCMYQKYGYCPYLFKTEKHCRKVRTLTGEKSNRFNLTQELGKVFEVYPVYDIEHNSNGTIKVDNDGKPIKKLYYITEKGKENKIGFRYEKNLADISKTIDSNNIVTKLYVLDVDSELSKTGMCSIKTAEDNPSKDGFIIDLSYYIKQGMLDKDQVIKDLYGIEEDKNSFAYLNKLGYYNGEYDKLTNKIINLQNASFTELEANLKVNLTGIETAQKELIKINRYMQNYNENSDAYKNYITKYQEQQAILIGLIQDTFYTQNVCGEPVVSPDEFIKDFRTLKWIRENYIDTHDYSYGMLGQYNEQYNQINDWKKQRAAYLKLINDLSSDFFKRYEPYLKEGTWSNENYLTDNAYYHDALTVAAEGAIPKVSYSIKVVPLGILDDVYEYDIADISYVEDIGMFGVNKKTGLPNRLKVLVSELNESLDKPTEDSIQVQNYTTQFEDLFQQVTASVQSLTFNENIYKRSSNFTATQNVKTESLQGTLDTNQLTLLNTDESNIKLDSGGQKGSDINNHNNKYELNGQGLYFSNDGGQIWNVGVGPNGINADYINTGNLDAGRIRIVDGSYVYFLWDKSGITAYRDKQSVDFARFNKYGLSLVENNKIRLRAGYEFNGINGDISEENDIGQNIGFYLYDKDGQPIFKTETDDNSARLSLAGEIYATAKLVQRKIKDYLYSIEYKFDSDRIYYIVGPEVSAPTGLIQTVGWITNNVELIEEIIYKDNNNNYYYKSEDDQYYSLIPATTKEGLTIDYNSETRNIVSHNYDIISYVEDNILKDVALYEVGGKYYEHKEVEYETDPQITNEISGYINNKAAYATDDYIEKEDGIYTKRLITYAKNDDNNNLQNVFSVLADGTLYMGGYIKPSEEDKSQLDNLDDYIRIISTNSSLQLTTDGTVLIGGQDAFQNLQQQINAVIAGIISMNLITHNHFINTGDINWMRPILPLKGKQTVLINENRQITMETKQEDVYFSTNKTPYIAISPTYPNDNTESEHYSRSTITWIKLDDFLNYIQGQTQYSGQATGSGGELVPSGGDTSPNTTTIQQKVLEATTKLVKSHYERGMHYQNPWWNDTTIDGRQIHSRTDCSGLVDGIFQYLGDAPTTYVNTTHTLASNPPNNWKVISLSALDYNPANLLPGDIIVNTAEHTEIVVQINGNNIKCKGFGSDSRLRDSYLYGGYTPGHSLGWYNWVLRKYQ